ncbi:hypothetical protein Q5H93_10620 [Hymenobacter sp. ASUV-10]|uniref:DUF4852 domain-containing protein n=1 Tax=Hymenobacter aranciens TaxID=3063996 RepID=A0ABT9BBM9_9BACT|nr:hypothetical protein [Hymenobacter sp. ASUV-10]MDO7875185.1 hypothetical protein [Hymenobacter sp. ASUV-10]
MRKIQGSLHLIIGLLLAVGLGGCQTVFQGLYGIRGLRPVSATELSKLAESYGIAPDQACVLDTSYRQFLAHWLGRDVETAKNHYQPLQASYYDQTGQLKIFYINCYAGGFPNLSWNGTGGLQQFPPAPQALADTVLPLPTYLRYLRQTDGQPLPALPAADYTVVVQWSRFMGRQSRRFIKAVQQNAALAQPGQSVRLLFVNNDNLQLYLAERQERWEKQAHH